MYSSIICEHPLPFSGQLEDIGETQDWLQFEFQTLSFGYEFGKFTISEDGQLYRDTYRLVEIPLEEKEQNKLPDLPMMKQVEDGIERMDYTGEIDFFGLLVGKKIDSWVELKALFWKGDLKELTLENLEKKDNSRRLESQEKIHEELKKYETSKKKWWYGLSVWYKRIIRVSFFLFKWFFAWIIRCLQGLEMWLLRAK
ncbi:hypothetical protein CL634_01785 [bacterium]|nr:hypothetical protein [bacterium]|tara:strand:+ start:293 stop:886 length:594 start_codon:yes stop_codon:yes gene_type:complete